VVANKYGDPYRELARYFRAVQLLTVERKKGLDDLQSLSKSGDEDVAARAKFALAQAREADGQLDDAAALYNELLKDKESRIAPATLNLRLAAIYERQGKKDAASDILFRMIEEARKAKGKDGKPLPETASVREADSKLETLNPERYAQLPPKPAGSDFPL
jgi:TolA-binding protein